MDDFSTIFNGRIKIKGEGVFKILETWKILDFGVVLNMKWIISRQLPDSPSPQQGASDPISGLTGLL